jgi:cephalosporin-C deacetylase-like acetyl esterase
MSTSDVAVDWLRFPSLGDLHVYGWLAAPKRARQNGNAGFLWLPGYSYGNPPPGPESLYPNTITLGLNLHGNTPDTPYIHPSTLGGEYITQGIDSPDTYIYRAVIGHCLRALAVLAALVDRERYRNLPNFRIPDGRALIEDYANAHPERREQVYETYRYFDPLSHAADIGCPTQMSAGGRDPSCKPPTIYAVYNALTCEKEMLYLAHTGHEIVPAMHRMHAKWVEQLVGEP